LFTFYIKDTKPKVTKTFSRFCRGQARHPFGTKNTAGGPAAGDSQKQPKPLLNTNQTTPHLLAPSSAIIKPITEMYMKMVIEIRTVIRVGISAKVYARCAFMLTFRFGPNCRR